MSTDPTAPKTPPQPAPAAGPAGAPVPPPPPPIPVGKRFGSKPFGGSGGGGRGPGGPGGGGGGFGGGGNRFPGNDRPRGDTPAEPVRADFGAFKPNKRALDQSIEEEMAAAMAGFQELPKMDGPAPRPAEPPKPGNRKKGRVVGVFGKDVFVDVPGGRGQGVLPIQQFDGNIPQPGDEVEFEIERYDPANGLLVLTKDGAVQTVSDWSRVAFGMTLEVKLTEMNKAKSGFAVEVSGIRGFLPLSQLDMYRVEKPEQLVGTKLKVMVVEVNAEEKNLIVSRRAVQEKEREVKAVVFWETIAEGQILKGMVKSIKPFGAFVDLGAADGLIPISELSWARVGTVEEVLSTNQLVEVKVMRLDRDARKIGLSLKALNGNPWDAFAANHRPGARITGRVTKIMEFGAFVELVPGVEGLVHVSELSTQRVRRVSDVMAEGQTVEVQIVNIDPESRRIALSLKAIAAEGEAAAYAAGQAEREAEEAEAEADAENRKATRVLDPNLRGGIGGKRPLFG